MLIASSAMQMVAALIFCVHNVISQIYVRLAFDPDYKNNVSFILTADSACVGNVSFYHKFSVHIRSRLYVKKLITLHACTVYYIYCGFLHFRVQ